MRRIFLAPALIALVSLIGLIAALLGDGFYDWLSWLGLGLPIAVIAWFWRRGETSAPLDKRERQNMPQDR